MTGDNIVQFPKPRDMIFTCQCGCTTFYIHKDTRVECANCQTEGNPAGSWYENIENFPVNEELPDGAFAITQVHEQDLAIARVMKKITKFIKENTITYFLGINKEGKVTSWSGAQTSDQNKWVIEKLENNIASLEAQGFPNDETNDS